MDRGYLEHLTSGVWSSEKVSPESFDFSDAREVAAFREAAARDGGARWLVRAATDANGAGTAFLNTYGAA